MISIAAETLVYRWAGFSPALSLLMPTFAFPTAPPGVISRLPRCWNAPLPLYCYNPRLRYHVLCPIIIDALSLDQ
jgi:hypothetical protein